MTPAKLEREEYARRWFDARDALRPIAVRLTTLSLAMAVTINVMLVPSGWVLIGWAFGVLVAATVGLWIAMAYAHTKGSSAVRLTHIWQDYYREPWRFVPRREEAS